MGHHKQGLGAALGSLGQTLPASRPPPVLCAEKGWSPTVAVTGSGPPAVCRRWETRDVPRASAGSGTNLRRTWHLPSGSSCHIPGVSWESPAGSGPSTKCENPRHEPWVSRPALRGAAQPAETPRKAWHPVQIRTVPVAPHGTPASGETSRSTLPEHSSGSAAREPVSPTQAPLDAPSSPRGGVLRQPGSPRNKHLSLHSPAEMPTLAPTGPSILEPPHHATGWPVGLREAQTRSTPRSLPPCCLREQGPALNGGVKGSVWGGILCYQDGVFLGSACNLSFSFPICKMGK